MFSVMCAILFRGWELGSHASIAHDALDFAIQGPPGPASSRTWHLTVQGPLTYHQEEKNKNTFIM